MPNFGEMKELLLRKMKKNTGVKITTDYNNKTITLDEDPYFRDYANLGAFLSSPSDRPSIMRALGSPISGPVKNTEVVSVFRTGV